MNELLFPNIVHYLSYFIASFNKLKKTSFINLCIETINTLIYGKVKHTFYKKVYKLKGSLITIININLQVK